MYSQGDDQGTGKETSVCMRSFLVCVTSAKFLRTKLVWGLSQILSGEAGYSKVTKLRHGYTTTDDAVPYRAKVGMNYLLMLNL